jgi:hypothetical protein
MSCCPFDLVVHQPAYGAFFHWNCRASACFGSGIAILAREFFPFFPRPYSNTNYFARRIMDREVIIQPFFSPSYVLAPAPRSRFFGDGTTLNALDAVGGGG